VKTQKKILAHISYKNAEGKTIPGATTILKNLGWNTDALIGWARREALAGNDPTKIKDIHADIGTLAHYLCECDIKGKTPELDEYSKANIDIAQECFKSFLEWKNFHKIEYAVSEMKLISEQYQYGGTIDLYCQSEGKGILADIKTSSGIFPEMKIQAIAYKQLLEEHGHKVDEVYILHLERDGGFTPHRIGKPDVYWEVFKHCLELEKLKKMC